MSEQPVDLTLCDREPIHVPGSVQPHGLLLVVDPETLTVAHAGGEPAQWLGQRPWQQRPLAELLGDEVELAARQVAKSGGRVALDRLASNELADISATLHRSGRHLIVELERALPAMSPSALLLRTETIAAAFENATDLRELFAAAANAFQGLTGYDRVMVYRFLDDDAGVVVAEALSGGQQSFLNHHFPATDIPRQACALYVRNRIRVIPDVSYRPAPLQPPWPGPEPLDMSDCALRSVSPIHLQYLRNMGVGASASISLVIDGALWGLIACHNEVPRRLPPEIRSTCRILAGDLARQIKSRGETDTYRERVRLRSFEDDLVALLSREGSLDAAISNHIGEMMRVLDGDGLAIVRGQELVTGGRCPPPPVLRDLARWAMERSNVTAYATDELGAEYELPEEHRAAASGLLAITLSVAERWVVLWFRAEVREVVNWAGNPHKELEAGPDGVLNPRTSFAAWSETVRGRARGWTVPEVEAANRLREAVVNIWQHRRIRDLNKELINTLDEREQLLRQKEYLIGEVNHRVQNSLQLVSGFLGLQARESEDTSFRGAIDEARRRIHAVSLVHRRLYTSEHLENIEAARYLEELIGELIQAAGSEWEPLFHRDLQPVMLPNDRAVSVGLVLTELVINTTKYAYPGAVAGPVRVRLVQDRQYFRLTVADEGVGRGNARKGFGSRMIEALVATLDGQLEYEDTIPGTRAVLTAPISAGRG